MRSYNSLNVNQSTSHEGSEVYTAEPDIPESSLIEVELAIEKLKKHKATGVDHIPSELIQAGGSKLYKEIHKLIVLIWNKEEFVESITLASISPNFLLLCSSHLRLGFHKGISLPKI